VFDPCFIRGSVSSSPWRQSAVTGYVNSCELPNKGYGLWFDGSNKVEFRFGSSIYTSATAITNDGEWHLVVATFDGSTRHLYIDGNLQSGSGSGQPVAATNRDLYFGTYAIGPGRNWFSFDGDLDDLAMWDTALTQDDVDWLWNNGDGQSVATLIPEPGSMLLLVIGAIGLLALRRRRK